MSEFDEQSTRDLEDDASDLFDNSDSMMITDEAIAVMAGVDYNETSTMNPDIKVKLYTTAGEFLTAPLKENVKIN